MNSKPPRAVGLHRGIAFATLFSAAIAGAGVPRDWNIELVCRSSLDPNIPAYHLPSFSSLSSQYVTLDEQGNIAIRFFTSGAFTEAIFVGSVDGGSLALTANSPDPVWSTVIDLRNGRFVAEDATLGPGGASVFTNDGSLFQRYELGVIGVDGIAGLADDGAIGYRAAIGLAGQGIVLDEFIGGVREQTILYSTLDPADNVDFILSPEMNANRQFVANTIPLSGPNRRIIRFSPDGAGAYTRETIAQTGPNADGNFTGFVNSVAIAPNGSIAFNARRAADSLWQVSRRDGPAQPIVSIARGGDMGIVNANLANFPPVVNSNGLVAFRVEDSAGSTALFVGDGSGGPDALVRIVGNGDIADTDLGPIPFGFNFGGTTGIQVMNGVVDINDANQVAFAAFLANGTIGVFVATPAGPDGCSPADIAEPFGVLDLADVQAFVAGFVSQDPIADLAPPAGVFDLADLQAFVGAFTAGCP
jgi:hypothetical protein